MPIVQNAFLRAFGKGLEQIGATANALITPQLVQMSNDAFKESGQQQLNQLRTSLNSGGGNTPDGVLSAIPNLFGDNASGAGGGGGFPGFIPPAGP